MSESTTRPKKRVTRNFVKGRYGLGLSIFLLLVAAMGHAADARVCRGICLLDEDDISTEFNSYTCTQELMAPGNSHVGSYHPIPSATTHICYDEYIAIHNANGWQNSGTWSRSVTPSAGASCYPYDPSSPYTNGTHCGGSMVYDDPICPGDMQGHRCVLDEVNPLAEMGVPPTSCPAFPRGPNPIYYGSGNKFLKQSDYQGVGANPLVLTRYYNSIDGEWRFSYTQSIVMVNGIEVRIVRPDGRAIRAHKSLLDGQFTTYADAGFEIEYDDVLDEYTVRSRNDEIETYDGDGDLISITNRAGQTTSLSYVSDQLATVTDHTGKTLTFTHDANNRVETITDPAGNVFEYDYDVNGQLEFVTYPDDTPATNTDNPRLQYHYEDTNDASLVTGITDELGIRYATYSYDAEGRTVLSELAGSVESTSVVYNADDTVSVTNALGKQTDYTFVVDNSVRKMTQADGQPTSMCGATVTTMGYDANGFIDSTVDENGNVTEFVYNDRGFVESKTVAYSTPDAITTTRTWHATLNVPIQIVRPGQTVDMTYDSAGRMLTRTITDTQTQSIPYTTTGNTRTTTYTYNALGLVETIDGPRTDVSDITTYAYDTNGDLLTVTNALGHITEITARDPRGYPTEIEDANDVVSALTYDERGRLTSRTIESSQGNATTSFVYDDASQLTSVTLPDGVSIDYEYDDAHRLIAIENNLGERIEYTLDDAGNRTAEVIKDGSGTIVRSMARLFDELSRLRENIGAQSQTTSLDYDLNNNLNNVEDALFNATAQAYDALDRLTTITDALLNDTTMDYDDRDNLSQVVDPRGIATNYVHDGLNNLIQEASADAGTAVHIYDAAGNRTQSTDARGVVSQYAYDALNRITAETYPANAAENVTYTYDTGSNGIGRLSSIVDVSGTTSYAYDDRGNVLTETRVIGSATYVTAYTYDLNNNLLSTTYPSGRIVTYARDVLARVNAVTTQTDATSNVENLATNIAYLPYGPSEGWTYGNGSVASRSFDQDYRLTDLQITTSTSTAQLDRGYVYDPVSNITDIINVVDASRTQSFDYDDLHRLTNADGVYGDYVFGLDEVGNRTVNTVDGTEVDTYTYFLDSNRLSTVDENGDLRIFSYDAAGNITLDDRGSGPDVLYEYNVRNRLIQVEVAQ